MYRYRNKPPVACNPGLAGPDEDDDHEDSDKPQQVVPHHDLLVLLVNEGRQPCSSAVCTVEGMSVTFTDPDSGDGVRDAGVGGEHHHAQHREGGPGQQHQQAHEPHLVQGHF